MSSHEFAEWIAYYNLEPFGDELALMDNHFASLQALIANVNRDPKKRRKAFELDDFRLLKIRTDDDDEIDQHKSPQEDYEILRAGLIRNQE